MISKPLLKREAKANAKVLLIFLIVISFYSAIIVAMYDPKLGISLNLMAESMPEIFQAFGMSSPGSSLIEFVGNYLYGFILVVFPLIFIIFMCSRLVARYVDRGSMAYLLATPNKRTSIIKTQALTLILGIFLLVAYATFFVIICGNIMFDEGINIQRFLLLNAGLLGLLLFFAAMNFLSCCIFNENRLAVGIGSGLSILFILIQMLSQVSDKIEYLKYATPMTLFQPDRIIIGEDFAIWCFLSLYVLALFMFVSAIAVFKHKDFAL